MPKNIWVNLRNNLSSYFGMIDEKMNYSYKVQPEKKSKSIVKVWISFKKDTYQKRAILRFLNYLLENKIHWLDVQFLLTNYPKIRRSLRMFNFWNFNAFIFFQSHKHNAKKKASGSIKLHKQKFNPLVAWQSICE